MNSYIDILHAILDNNDLTTYPISVDNLNNYVDKLVLTTHPVLYKPNYGIKIGNSSGVTIALSHKYIDILPFINDALKRGYKDIFSKELDKLNKNISYNNFYTSLTEE